MSDIKTKIKKLLALTSSPYEGEAMSALLKAKELMAKHKITEMDLEDNCDTLVHLKCEGVKWTTDSEETWIAKLCDTISGNHCCIAAWETPYKTRSHTLVISGLKNDAEVCRDVTEYAVGFVRGAVKSLQRRYRREDPKSIMKSYAYGFIQGLEMAYEAQRDEHPEWALVVTKPDEVRQYEEQLSNKTVKTRDTLFNPTAHAKGFNDGMEFNSRKVING